MAKSLFDHIKAITNEQNPKYFDTLEEADKKSWSNYMIHRFLSMNPDWVDLIAELQPYTQSLPPKALYLAHIGILPKGRHFLRYVKGKKTDKYEDWLVDLMVKDYQCSKKEATEYLEILYNSAKFDPVILTKPKNGRIIQNHLGHRGEFNQLKLLCRALCRHVKAPRTIQNIAKQIQAHR